MDAAESRDRLNEANGVIALQITFEDASGDTVDRIPKIEG